MKYAYAYVLDTMADWELGFVIAELNTGQYFKNRESRIPVKMVEQTRSMGQLLHVSFQWVLPRHGDWIKRDRTDMRTGLTGLIQKMMNTE